MRFPSSRSKTGSRLRDYLRQQVSQLYHRGCRILKQTAGAQDLNAHKFFTCRKIQGDIVGDTHGAALELAFQ